MIYTFAVSTFIPAYRTSVLVFPVNMSPSFILSYKQSEQNRYSHALIFNFIWASELNSTNSDIFAYVS